MWWFDPRLEDRAPNLSLKLKAAWNQVLHLWSYYPDHTGLLAFVCLEDWAGDMCNMCVFQYIAGMGFRESNGLDDLRMVHTRELVTRRQRNVKMADERASAYYERLYGWSQPVHFKGQSLLLTFAQSSCCRPGT